MHEYETWDDRHLDEDEDDQEWSQSVAPVMAVSRDKPARSYGRTAGSPAATMAPMFTQSRAAALPSVHAGQPYIGASTQKTTRPSPSRTMRSRSMKRSWASWNPLAISQGIEELTTWVLELLAYAGAAGLAMLLWRIGALCTNEAARAIGIPIPETGLEVWLLPLILSAIEVKFWPQRWEWRFWEWTWQEWVFYSTSAVDILSTVYGFYQWAPGRQINLGRGYEIPSSGWLLVGGAVLSGVLITFGPEQVVGRSLRGLLRTLTDGMLRVFALRVQGR